MDCSVSETTWDVVHEKLHGTVYIRDFMGLFYIIVYMGLLYIRDYMRLLNIRVNMGVI